MPAKYTNNATATLAASISDSTTTVVLTTGFGGFFPTLTSGFYFYATLFNAAGDTEIVKVTARSADTLTVVRAQDNTNAKAFLAGDGISLRVVAANMTNLVELDSVQTITGNKTFNSEVTISGIAYLANAANRIGAFNLGATGETYVYASAPNEFAVRTGTGTYKYFTIGADGNVTAGGDITAAGDITAFSDERLKSDIRTIPNALGTTCQLRGTLYTKDGKPSIGVVAQEVQMVVPQVVHENDDGYLSVAYGNLVGLLIEAVKELNEKVEKLERSS